MRRSPFLIIMLVLIASLALVACQTTPPVPTASPSPKPSPAPSPSETPAPSPVALIAPEPSVVMTESPGFSPSAVTGRKTITFDLVFGNPDAVKSWKLQMKSAIGVQKTFDGVNGNLPSSLVWDGKNDAGQPAYEGPYNALLSIEYRDTYLSGSAGSATFILDIQPPTATLALSQKPFSPIETGDTLKITINGSSPTSTIDSWSLDIYDPAGNLFMSFDGKWTNRQIVWDGKGISGDLVESAEDYPVKLTVRDGFDNVSVINSTIPIDILVEKTPGGYRILSSRIFFKGFTADYVDVPQELSEQNKARFDNLAAKLKKFPGYKIRLVGHAVMINWNDAAKGKIEQEKELIPLSLARANAVMQAMVDRGLDPAMLSATGVGAAEQLVPDSDQVNHWRNRRVAFFLDKP